MQGIYSFTGDTTNLIYKGQELERLSCDTNLYFHYPGYIRLDIIYIMPSMEGFLKWKEENGYN
jgi:hypothetical protein